MKQHDHAQLGVTVRAATVTGIAVLAIALAWHLRPAAPTIATAPDAAIVVGCAWLAWLLAGYLAVAVALTSVGRIITCLGRNGSTLTRLAPGGVRRLVDATLTLGLAAAVLGTTGAAAANATSAQYPSTTRAPTPATAGGLDWPGLTDPAARQRHVRVTTSPPATPHPARRSTPAHRAQSGRHHQSSHVGLVSGGGSVASPSSNDGDVVVQPGDSLWKIAARHLGPGASAQATAIAWHQWFAANQAVVGDNPDLIHPGQRLRPPQRSAAS